MLKVNPAGRYVCDVLLSRVRAAPRVDDGRCKYRYSPEWQRFDRGSIRFGCWSCYCTAIARWEGSEMLRMVTSGSGGWGVVDLMRNARSDHARRRL